MSETLSSTSYEHKEYITPNYGRAIQRALDGYARDGATWLRARHIFHETIETAGSPDAALRTALYEASEAAESTYEEATSRFWSFIEGEEGGNHARYSQAIECALDGYAKDGNSWLFARDIFFDTLGQGGDVQAALNKALAAIAEGAESSMSSAESDFWQEVKSASDDKHTVAAKVVDGEEVIRPSLERVVVWPDETIAIGGRTSRIEYSEAEQIFARVEIRGDGYAGKLTTELLKKAGLLPHHRLEAEQRTIWFSPGYDIGEGRIAVVGYVQDDTGSVVARSYYRSNSQGVWRYLPQYTMNENGELNWYSKGYGEQSITLPAGLQESLTRAIDDDGSVLQLEGDNARTIFSGTARYYNSEGTVYHRDVAKLPLMMAGVPEAGFNQLPPPETIRLTHEQAPKFDSVFASWQQETGLYGRVTCEVFLSNDSKLRYVVSRDRRGRAWISSIENDSPLESTGLRSEWISGGALTTPAEEYESQSAGYGIRKSAGSAYVDMFENYLSKIPVIREYLASVEMRANRSTQAT